MTSQVLPTRGRSNSAAQLQLQSRQVELAQLKSRPRSNSESKLSKLNLSEQSQLIYKIRKQSTDELAIKFHKIKNELFWGELSGPIVLLAASVATVALIVLGFPWVGFSLFSGFILGMIGLKFLYTKKIKEIKKEITKNSENLKCERKEILRKAKEILEKQEKDLEKAKDDLRSNPDNDNLKKSEEDRIKKQKFEETILKNIAAEKLNRVRHEIIYGEFFRKEYRLTEESVKSILRRFS